MPELEPMYNLKAVVQQTGIPAASLRAWERRYGIITPVRKPNGHRVYPRSEIEKLLKLKSLMARGMTIGQAATLLTVPGAPLPEVEPPLAGSEVDRLRDELTGAFAGLNTQAANAAFGQALELLTLGQMLRWVVRPLLGSLKPFGRSYLRSRLGGLLLQAVARDGAPTALVLQPDPKDLHPLLVAVLLSRRDYRVIYLEETEAPDGLEPDLLIDPRRWDGSVPPEQLYR